MSVIVAKEDYDRMVLAKIEDKNQRERASKVFDDYGPNLAFDVFNIMLHAIGLEKIPEVLVILEQHYREHLSFQHPEIRGTVEGMSGNALKGKIE